MSPAILLAGISLPRSLRTIVTAAALLFTYSNTAYAATPAFSVHKNGMAQTLVGETPTKLTWSTEIIDTNTNFSTDRFTPTVAGNYLIVVSVQCAQPGACVPAIHKNGTLYAATKLTNQTYADQSPQVTAIVGMNGSTDYVEAFATSSGSSIVGAATQTYFSGSQIDGAGAGSSQWTTSGGDIYYNTGNVGIGTAAPSGKLDIVREGAAGNPVTVSTFSDTLLSNGYLGRYARGTASGPTATQALDRTNFLIGASYGGSTWVNNAALNFYAAENQTESVRGSSIAFETTALGAIARTERLRIDPAGNVGIGTTSPVTKLDVFGGNARINTVSGGAGGWMISNNGATSGGFSIDHTSPMYSYLDFTRALFLRDVGAAHASRLTIDGNGNVGIGTSSPASKLDVVGSGQVISAISTTTAGTNYGVLGQSVGSGATFNTGLYANATGGTTNYGVRIVGPASGANNFAIYADGTAQSYFAGNVGIGTTSATAKLTIGNSIGDGTVDTYGEYQLMLWDSGTPVSSYGLAIKSNNLILKTASAIAFHGSAGTSIATINSSGTYAASDRNLKEDIAALDYGLAAVMQLKPASYRLKEDPNGPRYIGFIAQDVKQVVPEVVIGEEGQMQLAYPSLVPVLTKAIQELKADNDNLRAELRETVNSQDAEIESLRRELKALQSTP